VRYAPAILLALALGWIPSMGTGLAVAAEAEAKPGACRVWMNNGDMVTGQVAGIADGVLLFRPAVAPGSTVKISLGQVGRLVFGESKKVEAPTEGDMLELRDGSLLYGKLLGFTKAGLTFDIEQSGTFEFPRSAAVLLRRLGRRQVKVAPTDGRDVVMTEQGDMLVGRIVPRGGDLLGIRGKAVEATIPLASVAAIGFGSPADDTPSTGGKPLTATLATRSGTQLAGRDLRLEEGRLSISLSGGARVKVPLDRVLELTISGESTVVARRILVWGRFADRNEELRRTLDILKEHYGGRAPITEDFSQQFDAAFRKKLLGSRALLVPEMEQWDSSAAAQLASKLKPMVEAFLRRGGNVVFLGLRQRECDFLRQLELLDVSQSGSGDHMDVPFTGAGGRIAKGIGKSFRTTNGTYYYRVGTKFKAEAWATGGSGSPIVGRRIGRGWVILMGMDYYKHSPETAKLLINAIEYR